MTFCREFHMTYTAYKRQPADVMVKWRKGLDIEADAAETRRRIDEMRVRSKGRS